MKVLLTNYHGISAGGSQQSTQTIAQGLIEEGIEAAIASTGHFDFRTIHFGGFLPLTFFQNTQLKDFLFGQIKKEGFDLIHAQDRLTSFAAVLAAKKAGIPCIVHFRDYWFACTKSTCLRPDMAECSCSLNDIAASNPLYRVPWEALKIGLIRKNLHMLNDCGKKIAVSKAVHKKMLEQGIGENTAIIPNPVNLKQFVGSADKTLFPKFEGKKIILFAGRFSYEKGIKNLMKIIEKMQAEKKGAAFALAGDGPLKAWAEHFAKEKGLKNTEFFGNISFQKLLALYNACDIVVFPSVWQEPFGRVAVEAMAAKKPVIASNVGGITETVEDGKNGFLILPNDINEWVKKCVFLLENEKTAKEFGKHGRKKAEAEFGQQVIAKKIINVYKEAL
ncbi:MAG: glycosyltransferase family 4 protein [archaeon]